MPVIGTCRNHRQPTRTDRNAAKVISNIAVLKSRSGRWPSRCIYRRIEGFDNAMLRICHSQQWTLCGQLAGPWVQELRSCWEHGPSVAAGSAAVVDLSDVTFIDEDGEKLLSEMRTAGVEFVATGVETRHLLENLKGRGEKSVRRMVGSWRNAANPSASVNKKLHSPCRSGESSFVLTSEEGDQAPGDTTNTTKREKK